MRINNTNMLSIHKNKTLYPKQQQQIIRSMADNFDDINLSCELLCEKIKIGINVTDVHRQLESLQIAIASALNHIEKAN